MLIYDTRAWTCTEMCTQHLTFTARHNSSPSEIISVYLRKSLSLRPLCLFKGGGAKSQETPSVSCKAPKAWESQWDIKSPLTSLDPKSLIQKSVGGDTWSQNRWRCEAAMTHHFLLHPKTSPQGASRHLWCFRADSGRRRCGEVGGVQGLVVSKSFKNNKLVKWN